jgi:hypothetical protein
LFDAESWRRLTSIVAPEANRVGTQVVRLQPLDEVHDIAGFAEFITTSET